MRQTREIYTGQRKFKGALLDGLRYRKHLSPICQQFEPNQPHPLRQQSPHPGCSPNPFLWLPFNWRRTECPAKLGALSILLSQSRPCLLRLASNVDLGRLIAFDRFAMELCRSRAFDITVRSYSDINKSKSRSSFVAALKSMDPAGTGCFSSSIG